MVRNLNIAPRLGANFLLRHRLGLWQNNKLLDGDMLA